MSSLKFPYLVWQDVSGQYTAALLEEDPAAVGPTRQVAVEELRAYLRWLYTQQSWRTPPDFRDPQLLELRVPVRPEYSVNDRLFPCDEQISLPVHCVHGVQEGGLRIASVPVLGVRFCYYQADSLRDLVVRAVQQRLRGMTPRQISRFLPPSAVWVDQFVIRLPRQARRTNNSPTLPALSAVAEPVAARNVRRQFGPAWERDAELQDFVARIRRGVGNLLLLGDSGVGKSTLMAAAASLIEREDRAARRKNDDDESPRAHRFWLTNGGRLIAGMKFLGQWEERCEEVIAELSSIGGVLCVENLLDLVRTGGCDPSDSVGSFLQTYLLRGELRIIAEATPSELEACRRLLPGLADAFQVVKVPPFESNAAVRVLERMAAEWKQNRRVEFDRGVVELIYRLFRRFAPYQSFPGRTSAFVAQLADEALTRGAKSRDAGEGVLAAVDSDAALSLFVRQTGLPELFLRDEVPLEYDDAVSEFRCQIIGQEDACRAAARLVISFKAGMNDPHRPVGVLLFCGPTGVGKTELGRALARYFFGAGEQADRLIRLDMSEYTGFDAAQRLLGRPDGEPSELIRRVRAQPFCVVLLDEIEKADPDVFDVLMGLFDEGRLTDRYGRTTSFRSAIVILTSNIGSDRQKGVGFGAATGPALETQVQAFFRPEFYNRLDAVVTFAPLEHEVILAITRKELEELNRREGIARLRVQLAWNDAVVEQLAREGFDPRYGARPLQRTLERRVVAPLARWLLEHPEAHDCRVLVDVDAAAELRFRAE